MILLWGKHIRLQATRRHTLYSEIADYNSLKLLTVIFCYRLQEGKHFTARQLIVTGLTY